MKRLVETERKKIKAEKENSERLLAELFPKQISSMLKGAEPLKSFGELHNICTVLSANITIEALYR